MRNKTINFVTAVSCLCMFAGCFDSSSGDAEDTINKTQNIQTISIRSDNISISAHATAVVSTPANGSANVTSPVSGIVSSIAVHVGDVVKKGTPLVTVKSTDTSDATAAMLAAKSATIAAKKTFLLNKELYAIGAVASNDLLASKATYEQNEAAYNGLKRKLSLFGAQSSDGTAITSPMNGVVYEIGTHLGERVQQDPNTALVRIADTHKKILVANVDAKNILFFTKGTTVTIDMGTGLFQGIVTYIAEAVDADSKTLKVYISPTTSSEEMKINMFAKITSTKTIHGIEIPKSAILNKDGKLFVFVQHANSYTPQEIHLAPQDGSKDSSIVLGINTGSVIAKDAIMLERP